MAAIVLAIILTGTFVTKGPGAGFNSYTENLLLKPQNEGKAVIIGFSAQNGCSPCRELDELTFHDARVVDQTAKDFILIKVDLTRKGDPVHEKLLQKYHIKGVPILIFLDKNGREMTDLRLVDFEPPGPFLERLNKAKQSQ